MLGESERGRNVLVYLIDIHELFQVLLLSLSSKMASALKMAVAVVLMAALIFSYVALALAPLTAITFLQSSSIGHELVQMRPM